MKNILIVTGGAGFIGSNLIEELSQLKKYKIISVDNYSSGTVNNHIRNSNIIYLKGDTRDISKILKNYKNKIHTIFHLGEFARIFKSFEKINECFNSNVQGSLSIFNFALKNKIKLIYSATSATLGNKGEDKNLSPYAFTKSKNLELLENLKKWFNFKYEVIYFYNVYGPRQICKGSMATVIGIFQDHFKAKKKLPIVRPGTQSRRFTHVYDTVQACIFAWRKNNNKHYSIANKESYSILELAKLFRTKVKYIPQRKGERFTSYLTKKNLNNRIIRLTAKISLKNYIKNFLKNIY